jgi:DtxR family Mn-dependent transcriptional regulator
MVQHDAETSEAEEMYLITIARAIEDGEAEPIPTSLVARELGVSGVSVNQMIRKLATRGFITYEPYRGVTLTDTGRSIALSTLRRRRLWGVFLAEQLGMSPGRADDVACDLEHVTPDDVADLLSGFLGHPESGPTGRLIPSGVSRPATPATDPLSSLGAGTHATVVAIALTDPLESFAVDQGFTYGATVEVLGVGAGGDRIVAVSGACVHLGLELADGILVKVRQ